MFFPYWVVLSCFFISNVYLALGDKVVICYMAAWAVFRPVEGRFTVRDVDPSLCTHLVYAFMGLNETTGAINSVDPKIDLPHGLGQLLELKIIKQTNPSLKVMLSVGGWAEGSTKFSNMAASSRKRAFFIASAVEYLREYELDGLDICWRYPTQRGGVPEDKRNFIILLNDMRDRFNREGWLLTVRLSPKRYVIDPGYDVQTISNLVDYISLATFEYNGGWDHKTGVNAPLFSDDELNIEFSVDYMIKKGANPRKILLGIPTFGRTFLLKDMPQDGSLLGLEAENGNPGPWTRIKGSMGYNELCYDMNNTAWAVEWDAESRTPIAFRGRNLVSFDNSRSIAHKMKVIPDKGLGGAMIWTLDTDDFLGLCHGIKYPILRTVNDQLNTRPFLTHSSSEGVKDEIDDIKVVSHVYG